MNSSADSAAERALLARIAQDDRAALTELFDLTAPRVYAVLLRWVNSPEDADLILQRVFLRLWNDRTLSRFSTDRPLLQLIESARQLARNGGFSRAQAREDRPGPAWPAGLEPGQGPEPGLALNPKDLLRAVYFEGETVSQLVARHGLSPQTLRETLVAAMIELRRELKAEK